MDPDVIQSENSLMYDSIRMKDREQGNPQRQKAGCKGEQGMTAL